MTDLGISTSTARYDDRVQLRVARAVLTHGSLGIRVEAEGFSSRACNSRSDSDRVSEYEYEYKYDYEFRPDSRFA